jgi:hypothetical protein
MSTLTNSELMEEGYDILEIDCVVELLIGYLQTLPYSRERAYVEDCVSEIESY